MDKFIMDNAFSLRLTEDIDKENRQEKTVLELSLTVDEFIYF